MARHNPRETDKIGMIIALITLCASLAGPIAGLTMIHEARQTMHWPEAKGSIDAWSIERYSSKRGKSRTTRYRVHVTYTYFVAGKQHRSSRFAIGAKGWHSTSARPEAVAWAKNHAAKGREVRVYYDPSASEQAVIHRGTTGTMYFVLFFPTIFTGVAWMLVQHARPEKKRPSKKTLYLTSVGIVVGLLALEILGLALV